MPAESALPLSQRTRNSQPKQDLGGGGAWRLFSADEEDFKEELRRRSRAEVRVYNEATKGSTDNQYLRRKWAKSVYLEELGYDKASTLDGRAEADYAAKRKIDGSKEEVIWGTMSKEASARKEQQNLDQDIHTQGFQSFYRPGSPTWEKMNKEDADPRARAIFIEGAEAAVEHGAGGVRENAAKAVEFMKLFADKPLATAGEQRELMKEVHDWWVEAPQDKRDRFRQAIAIMGKNEGLVSDTGSGLVQRGLRAFGSALDAVAGVYTAKTPEGVPYLEGEEAPEPIKDRRSEWFKLKREMYKALDEDVSPLYHHESAGVIRRGLESGLRSIPFTLAAAAPGGLALAAAPMETQQIMDDLSEQYPDADPVMVRAVGYLGGLTNAAIERVQLDIGSKWFKGMGKSFQALPTKPIRALAGGAVRSGIGFGGEFLTETVQEFSEPVYTHLINEVTQEFPGFKFREDWDRIWAESPVRFWSVVPLTLLGGAGRTVQNGSIRRAFENPLYRAESGVSEDVMDDLAQQAEVDPQSALEGFREASEALTPEERAENRGASMRSLMREQAEETETPRILQTAEGAEVFLPGEEGVRARDQNEAMEALAAWEVVDEARNVESLREILDTFEELKAGTAETEALAQETVEARGKAGLKEKVSVTGEDITPTEETPALQAAKAVEGVSGRAQVVARNWVERGAEGEAETVIEITKGNLNPYYVIREGAQGYLKQAVANKEVDYEWLADHLETIGERIGQPLKDRTNRAELIERFSDVVVGYAAGDIQAESLPSGLRTWLNKFLKTIARMLRVANVVNEMREGKELDPELENHIRRALGAQEVQPQQLEERALEEVLGEAGETYSVAPQDAAYLAAVESGDMATAQRMVDEAARAAGYDPTPMYHGSDRSIEEFSPLRAPGLGTGVYFTSLREEAKEFGEHVHKVYLRRGKELRANKIPPGAEETNAWKRHQSEWHTIEDAWQEDVRFVDEVVEELGYASISNPPGGNIRGEEVIVKDPSQIKSADPVTYDAAGNVVPLSQRFDPARDEITFSVAPVQEAARLVGKEGETDPDEIWAPGHWFRIQPVGLGLRHRSMTSADEEAEGVHVTQTYGQALDLESGWMPLEGPHEIVVIKGPEDLADTGDAEGWLLPEGTGEIVGRIPYQSPTYSVAPANPLLAALQDRIARGDETLLPFFEKMQERVEKISEQFAARDDGSGDLQPRTEVSVISETQRVLPRELKGFAGSAVKLADFKSLEAMERELARRIPRVERALEASLVTGYRKAIRARMKAGASKTNDSRKRSGKIGAAGHAIFDEAKSAMKLSREDGDARAEALLKEIEDAAELTEDRLDELEGKMEAATLFADYENAGSVQLKEGLELLNDVYHKGREVWLKELGARKARRTSRVSTILSGLPAVGGRASKARAKRFDEGKLKRFSEGFMSAGLSGSQIMRRLGEATMDPTVRDLVDDMEQAFGDAENLETDLNYLDNEELSEKLLEVTGATTHYGVAKRLKEWSTAGEDAPVTTLEGKREVESSVPFEFAGALVNRETGGFQKKNGERVDLNLAQLKELERLVDEYEDLPEDQRGRKRTFKVKTLEAAGERKSIGPVTKLEALSLLLTLRQPDQFEKLERMGYDNGTVQELEKFIPDKLLDLGNWMVGYLRKDQDILDKIHRSEFGVSLGLVKNYFPVRNDVARSELQDLALEGGEVRQAGRSVGFVKQRVTNTAEPAVADALAVFLAHRSQVNFWKSHVGTMREWGGVIRDERLAGAVKSSMGDKYYGALEHRLQRIEAGGQLKVGRRLAYDRLIRNMKRRLSMGVLGGRISTLMVNLNAGVNPGLEIPARELVKGMLKVMRRPAAFQDAWNSPAIQRRLKTGATFEATLAKASGPDKRPIVKQLEAWAEKGVAPINYVDTASNLVGATAIWEYTRTQMEDAGESVDASKAAADQAVDRFFRRAAQPTLQLSRSELELSALESPIASWFSLFVSEPRKNLSVMYLSARDLIGKKNFYQSKAMAAQAFAVSAVFMIAVEYAIRALYRALAKAGDDDEEGIFNRWWASLTDAKGWAATLATSHLNGLPMYGQGWEYVAGQTVNMSPLPGENVRFFNSSENPLVRVLSEGFTSTRDLLQEDATVEDAIDVVQSYGQLTPGGPIFSQLANLGDFAIGTYHSNVSASGKVERLKGRYNDFRRELTERHGKTGTDEKVAELKDAETEDWLKSHLSAYPPDQKKAFTDSAVIKQSIRKNLGIPKPPKK